MRFLLAFAVTCSFLAGQTCGNGVRVFHPLAAAEGEIMSKMETQCDLVVEDEVEHASAADCGPGQCIAQGKTEPDPALSIVADAVVPTGPSRELPSDIVSTALIAFAETPLDSSRPPTVVRRE